MTIQTIKRKHAAWKKAKDEAWKLAWDFADAVAAYAKEKPRGYSQEVAAATGLTDGYVRTVKQTATVYSSRQSRNPESSFRAHMEYTKTGKGGEWVPDGTTLRDVSVPEKSLAKVLAEAPIEQVEHAITQLPRKRQRQIGAAAGEAYTSAVSDVADNTRRNVTEGISGMFVPDIDAETDRLIAKLAEVKDYLDRKGDQMIPDPMGEGPAESIRDLVLGAFAADKGRIDNAFAEIGVGTSIEEGFRALLSDKREEV